MKKCASVRPNTDLLQRHVKDLLKELGYDADDAHFRDTPRRVAAVYATFCNHSELDVPVKVFPANGYNELVIVRDVSFFSMCAHHLLPFWGRAHFGYLPDKKVCGLSKVARVIRAASHRFTVQEELAAKIADYLFKTISPEWMILVLEAEHMCMSMRGVMSPGHTTMTSAIRGNDDGSLKKEFFALLRKPV